MFHSVSPRIRWLTNEVRGDTILDVGFVGSYETPKAHAAIRNSNPKSTIVAIDIDKEKVLQHAVPQSIVASGFSPPIKHNVVDTVVLTEILEHVKDWQGLIKGSARVLKNEGTMIITTPNPFGIFRILRHWLFAGNLTAQDNLKTYLGASDHLQFIEPLSLINILLSQKLRPIVMTTTNLSIPYLPQPLKDPNLAFWPLNRLGTYTCIKAKKFS